MSRTETPPVIVCRHRGDAHRFFGRYRDPDERDAKKRWKKIPGGAFPPEVDTEAKALACARKWYEVEMSERARGVAAAAGPKTLAEVCVLFAMDVESRVRGSDATRDELIGRSKFLRKATLLATRPLAQHDDELAVTWIRQMLSEPRHGEGSLPRDPLTVRNVAKVLDEVYKFAQARGFLPKERRRPTECEGFKKEIAGALSEKQKLGKLTRVPIPVETVAAIVNSPNLPELRRAMTRTAFFTGVRPGELHGLRVRDYVHLKPEGSKTTVLVLDVREQWTLARVKLPSRLGPLKTVLARRKIPVHPELELHLDAWLAKGWERHVGRAPKDDDFLFPDAAGKPFREERCAEFLADVERAGCSPTFKGVELDLYSLRHAFATAARRAGIPSDGRDRLLGHRPRDTKALHYEDEDLPLLALEVAKIPGLDPSLRVVTGDDEPIRTPEQTAVVTKVLVTDLVTATRAPIGPSPDSSMIAEEKGFEPLVELSAPRRFSKPVP